MQQQGEESEELLDEDDSLHRLPGANEYGSELDLTGAAIALDPEPKHPPGDKPCWWFTSNKPLPDLLPVRVLQALLNGESRSRSAAS